MANQFENNTNTGKNEFKKLRIHSMAPATDELRKQRDAAYAEYIEASAEKKAILKQQFEKLERLYQREKRFNNIQDTIYKSDAKKQEAIDAILTDKKFDDVRNSDLLTLKMRGIDIANLLLVDTNNPEKEVHSLDMKAGDSFIVNFGENKSLDKRTGAGDILPPNVRTVKINGIECERRNAPRPGYYNDSQKPPYQDIHDGYTIQILSLGNVTPEDNDAIEQQWKKERMRDMINTNSGNTLTDLNEDTELQKDEALRRQITNQIESEKNKYRAYTELDINSLSKGDTGLLDFISHAEGTHNNYNAIFGDANQASIDFTSMTLDEILAYQNTYRKEHGSAAIGKYQFMHDTLAEMMEQYNISGNTIFSPEFQDKLAYLKLEERGLSAFKNKNISLEGFQMNLSQEWASIAKDSSGLSYYHGDTMNNHASNTGKQIRNALETLYA